MTSRVTATGWTSVSLALVLALTGCVGDADGVAGPTASSAPSAAEPSRVASEPGGEATISDGATEPEGDASGSGDVEDLAIPAPRGIVLDALADAKLDIGGQRQLYYRDDDFDRVVAFYDDWTGKHGEWARGQSQDSVTFQRLDGDRVSFINITPDQQAGDLDRGLLTFVLIVAG